jgi:PAS domain S-box-containing protein
MVHTVKILIVENDTIVALNLQNILEGAGYKVSAIVSSGEEAFKAASLQKPNLILIAITLPGNLDCMQVTEQICSQFKIPAVYLATHINQATLQQAKVTEPYGYLLKPFEPRQLYSAIEITLYRHQTYQSLKERKQLLETTFSSIGDIVITTDEDGLIASMNPFAESLTGWKREEAHDRKLSQVFRIINERRLEVIACLITSAFDEFQSEFFVQQQSEAQLQASEQFLRSLYEGASTAIFVVDVLPGGKFCFIGMNPASEQLTRVRLEEVQGKSLEQVFPPDTAAAVSANYVRCIQLGTTISYEECLPFQGRDSWWLTTLTPLRDTQSRIYRLIGNAINITERKQVEEQLYASLQEKEVLLKEIHHRVKNNLQVILSLLDLQSQQTQEQHILEMFQESQNRIRSMAIIHEELYQSSHWARINFADYIHRLLTYLFQIYGVNPDNITLRLNIDIITFNIDTAIPCGLIINELVSNALKYAFLGKTNGAIWVELNSVSPAEPQLPKNQFMLVVGNDGIELQESTDLSTKKSLGWQLVRILVGQLEGQLEIEQNQGTVFKIRFSAINS